MENINKCNCRNKEKCPLENKCLQEDVIYKATINTNNNKDSVEYIGSTNNFKSRFTTHTSSFKNKKYSHATTLSKYVWENSIESKGIKWSILTKAPSYSTGNKLCDLCITEKLFIIQNINNYKCINKRSELAQTCRHKAKFKLNKCK